MAERVISWNRATSWIRISILAAAGAGIVYGLFRLVPFLIEDGVEAKLLDAGVVVTAFPVESFSLDGIGVGQGQLLTGTATLSWNTLWVGYSLGELMAGRIDELYFEQPVLSLQVGAMPALPVPDGQAAAPDLATPPAVRAPPGGGAGPPASPAPLPLDAPRHPSLREQLLQLPLNRITGNTGVLEFRLLDEPFASFSLDGSLESQPYGAAGELVLENDWLAAELALRVPANKPVITVQADAVMPPGAIREIQQRLVEVRPEFDALPQVLSSGAFALSLFLEVPQLEDPYGSAEASIEELGLRFPAIQGDIMLNRLLVAGTLQNRRITVQGGAEVLPLQIGGLATGAFGLRIAGSDAGELQLETEAFDWHLGGLTGRAALRGSARQAGESGPAGRLEASLSAMRFQQLAIDPFSILLESAGDQLRFKSSPIGLVRNGNIWIEDLAGDWNLANAAGSAAFSWYNLSGRLMGTVAAELEQPLAGTLQARLRLQDHTGAEFLAAHYHVSGDQTVVSATGRLPVDWLSSLNKWWGLLPVAIAGAAPTLDLQLSGLYPFLAGTARIGLPGLDLELENGVRMEDIRGDLELQVNLLPRADTPQLIRIGRIRNGATSLEDVLVEWDMPSVRNLRIRQVQGRLAGGRLRLEAFELDPADPRFRTVLHLENIDGNLLLELLGEKRFTLLGALSGQLAVGWEADTLILGSGSLRMETAARDARFLFTDQQFLKERFAAFAGVPAELRDRFLEALLTDGIRIQTLDATLGPSGEAGKILLRIAISGDSRSERLEVPIKGFVINNLIPAEDLARLLNLFGGLQIRTIP